MQENQLPSPLDYSRPESPTKPGTRWLWLLALLGLTVFVVILIPSTRYPHDGSRIKCASNLKQIGLSIQMYANENRGTCPPSFDEILLAGDLTSEVFVCPATNDQRAEGPTTQAALVVFHKPGFCSYIYVLPVGTRLSTLAVNHIVAYESPSNHIAKSGNSNGINVLYADGSAKMLDDKESKHVIAELQAGHNPPRPPSAMTSSP